MTTWIHKVFCTFMGDKSEIGVCWIMAGFAFVLERMKPSRGLGGETRLSVLQLVSLGGGFARLLCRKAVCYYKPHSGPHRHHPPPRPPKGRVSPSPSTAQYQEVIVHGGMLACVHYWRPESAKTRKANVQHEGPV